MNIDKMREQLISHEGLRLKPYKDTVGKWTIGVGRNLTDNGISKEEAMILLDTDMKKATIDAKALVDNFDELGDVRQRVLVDMAFNLGRSRLGGFRRMLDAVKQSRFSLAADEMVDSKWFRQTGVRAAKLELMMRTGEE